MQTINEIQDEVIEEFEGFDDWMDKYQMLIDLGNDLEPLEEQYRERYHRFAHSGAQPSCTAGNFG